MGFGFFEDRAVRRGLPLVIVGLDVVAAHRVVFELVPHQNTTEIGMADEGDAEEIEDFAFLKFAGAPDGRERGDGSLVGAVAGAQTENHGAVAVSDRVEMIDDLEKAGLEALGLLFDDFRGGGRIRRIGRGNVFRFDDFFFGPVDAGDVGALVEFERRIVAEKFGDGAGVGGAEEQRVLSGDAGIRDDGDLGTGKPGEEAVANLLRGFHGAGERRRRERERLRERERFGGRWALVFSDDGGRGGPNFGVGGRLEVVFAEFGYGAVARLVVAEVTRGVGAGEFKALNFFL